MTRFCLTGVIAALLLSVAGTATSQDDAPKPSVTVSGTCVYLGKPRDSIVVTLAKIEEPTKAQEPEDAEKPKPVTSTTNDKGEFEFKGVEVGKYRLTAKGRPQNSIRAFEQADPVDFEVTADTESPVTKTITLTLSRAR